MAEPGNTPRPIQVFLDTGQFISARKSRQHGGNRDFFGGDNLGFSHHKSAMRQRIQGVCSTLRRDGHAAGFVIVQMRDEALAKSYRPLNALFSRANSFHLAGGGEVGEIFFQCTPSALERLDHRIEVRAEVVPRLVKNDKTGKLDARPSTCRSELGGIEDIRLPTSADRIAFSAREAADWLSRPNTLGAYLVELFRPNLTVETPAIDSMIKSFRQRLAHLGGIIVLPLFPGENRRSSQDHMAISIQLTRDIDRSFISLPLDERSLAQQVLPRDALRSATQNIPIERHQHFLEQMAAEPMVRRISLPPSLEIAPLDQFRTERKTALPPPPRQGSPVVGIIDGGIADIAPLAPWRAGGTNSINQADLDLSHGTFIAGLIAGARSLNPHIVTRLEPMGCRYFDIPLMPRQDLFSIYYDVPSDFFHQLEEEVIRAKSDAGIRIFNLSLGAPDMRQGLGYSVFARALDNLATEHDIVFVVSVGNLRDTDTRPLWPTDGSEAVRLLTRASTADELITAPAEQLLGLSVGALNPPGVPGHNADLPTTYTRRGPGVGGARKPDLSHYGGAWPSGGNRTGLFSFASDSTVVANKGTSFAAPLVASTVAAVDHQLNGTVPRETLIALLVHRAQPSQAMRHAALQHVAPEFVGFGTAPPSDACLTDKPHSITLVFSDSLSSRHELQFVFTWPSSLVTSAGKCRGNIDLTLAFTPPIDTRFDAECLRVQLEAHLYQIETDPNTGEDNLQPRLKQHGSRLPAGLDYRKAYLLKNGLKWTPVKRYHLAMPQGRGRSSNWCLALRSSTRAGDVFPAAGVPFTIVMTISDLDQSARIYDEVRNEIRRRGLELADITVAHRVRPRS